MQIVAVTVDPPDKLLKVKNKIDAEFNFISDPDLKLMDQFGLRHENGNPIGGDIARPATLLVSKEGTLLWSFYPENYRIRPRPNDVLAAAKKAMGG